MKTLLSSPLSLGFDLAKFIDLSGKKNLFIYWRQQIYYQEKINRKPESKSNNKILCITDQFSEFKTIFLKSSWKKLSLKLLKTSIKFFWPWKFKI